MVDDLISKIISEMMTPERAETSPELDDEKARIAAMIDHTNLYPDAVEEDIRRLCEEALQYKFACAVVQSCWVPLCADLLKGSGVKVCSIVAFPLGGDSTASKVLQAQQAIEDGAQELDIVANVGYLKSGKFDLAEADVAEVVRACGEVPVKVIIEACLLTDEEKVKACLIAKRSGAAFVKTSTGFREGATAADVALMRRVVGPEMGVKASGGIRTLEQTRQLIDAGANRIGTSASVGIVG